MENRRIFWWIQEGVSLWLMCVLVVQLLGVSGLALLLAPQAADAAIVTIDATTSTDARTNNNTGAQTVFISDQIGYAFYRDSTGQCVYSKTTDGGALWGSSVLVDSQTDCIRITVWYDQWTPGLTGTSIHILTMDTSLDDLFYNRLDTDSDTLLLGASPVNVASNSGQSPTFSTTINTHTLTVATDGEIYAATNDNSDSYAVSCASACNLTTSWSEVGISPFDQRNDHNILMPSSGGDIVAINRDISANLIRSKIWNGTVWDSVWTTVDTAASESVEYAGGMSATIDLATGHIYLAYVTDNSSLTDDNDDIQTAVYDGSAWTQMADVATNLSGRGIIDAAIAIDQNNGDVYVSYATQDTPGTAASTNIYYKESTDSMTTWGSEEGPINTNAGDIRKPALDPSNAERLYVTWWEAASNDRFGETLANIGPDTTVSATGTQVVSVRSGTSGVYLGGTFIMESLFANTLSALTITETGSIDASTGLDNVAIYYDLDTTAPYDCTSESYSGTETQFGSTATGGFSAPDGVVTASGAAVGLSPTATFCGYVVLDVTGSATDGSTIDLQITDPTTDVVITGSDPFPATTVTLPGSTTVVSPDLTQTHYHWRNDDGSQAAATSVTAGVEDTPVPQWSIFDPIRLRVGLSVEGSTSTDAQNFQLEYTTSAATCAVSTGWTAVDSAADAFAMYDSPNLTEGANTTNISVSSGGVSDENTTFLTPNGGVRDTTDTAGPLTLGVTNFVELEYSIVATTTAVEGTTYCFRVTNAGDPVGAYAAYPQLTINADLTVATVGTMQPTVDIPTVGAYLGGSFLVRSNAGSHTLTALTLTETGTIDASTGLDNVAIYYDLDTTAPYDCTSESYSGAETQFGSTAVGGFSAPDGVVTVSGSLSLTTTQAACLYVVADITTQAGNGETIQYEISSPTADITAGGATVAPSEPVTATGSTTALGPIMEQAAYHWRNDDGSQAAATSLTSGSENTPVTDFQLNTPVRLRLAVSNEGATSSLSQTYQLQFAEQAATCSLASGWTAVDAEAEDAWNLFDSSQLTHGADTTNIAVSTGGVTDPNTTFVGTAGVRETTASSTALQLSQTQFAEFEYSLTSTFATEFDTTYCFRLVVDGAPLDTYTQYPTITTATKRDFKVQRGTLTITGTTQTITAGVDYEVPANPNTAFVRITNTNHTGAGDTVGGGSQDVEEVTAYIVDPENIDTSTTFGRDRALNDTVIDWEIVEFIGRAGTDNEMVVRDVGVRTLSSVETVGAGAVTTVDDDSQVVVFVTGASGNDTANDFYGTQVTAVWDGGSGTPIFTRGATGGSDVDVSYAVVEFTGINWDVQRIEHTYTAAGVTETQPMAPITSVTQAFVHAQKRVGASAFVGSHGHEVFLSSIGAVSFVLSPDADLGVTHTSVAWVISNTQTGVGAMQVERQSGTTISGAEPLALSIGISTPVDAVSNSSLFGNSSADGTNTAFPRSIAGLRLTADNTYQLWRSDTGTTLRYRTEIVQWPIADLSYRQNYYRWYVDNDLLTPSDAWPEGGEDLGENTSITDVDDPPGVSDRLRLRMTVQARNANWPADFVQFGLEYGQRLSTCTAVTQWAPVGEAGSTTALWRGVVASGTSDGTVLSTDPPLPGDLLISVSDVAGSLELENNTATNTYLAFDSEDVEYDWVVQHNGATPDTPYCFRMVEADGSLLSGYLQYPQVRTADYTPTIADWRWYDDAETETPVVPLSASNTAPTNIGASTTLALRVVVPESKSVTGSDIKFQLQFSEDPTFATFNTVVASSTCTFASIWCYDNGGALDNATITTAIVGSSDPCVGTVGSGCGTHNSSPTYVPGHTQAAGTAQEYSFTITSTALRPNVVYYFRLYDIVNARTVALANGASYPTLVGEGAGLTFTVNGLPAATTTAGVVTDATTTAAAIDFGVVPVGGELIAAQRITIDTNAVEGYRVFKYARSGFTNGSGLEIPAITGTNLTPASWSTACITAATGCVGYHTTDATLGSGSARFAPTDTYAALEQTPREIMFSSLPATESHDVVYRVSATEAQPAGEYQTSIVYIATPVY